MEETVTLIAQGGENFQVLVSIVDMSKTLRDLMAESLVVSGSEVTIPLPEITGKALEAVVEYCMRHKDDTVPAPVLEVGANGRIPDKAMEVSEWDAAFCKDKDDAFIYQIAFASNHLSIDPLLHLVAKEMALRIVGKSPKEIFEKYNAVRDPVITDDEKAAIQLEHPWLK